ncbi:MAG TPA: ABC transporter ATP-binding protein [Paenirhodobacter sp.]
MNAPLCRGAAIDIRGVSKFYGRFTALKDVDLQIEPGEFMSFLGPSGSGKTTTLNLIAGFASNDTGSIALDGRPIDKLPPHKRNIGVVFQHYALFPHMTVAQNVAYPLRQRKVGRAERDRAVMETLSKVKLDSFAHRYPSELSGGQQQRVALARAMVFNPALLLMDEPLGALDKKLREVLQLEIKRIHRELGSTFVYVTHDQEEALVLSDRIAVFSKGRLEQVGTGHDLYTRPKTLFVGQFIGESAILRGVHRYAQGETALEIGDQRIVVRGPPKGDGAQVILLRPEDVHVQKQGTGVSAGRDNLLTGRICERLYLGSAVKYEIRLPDGSTVTARTSAQDEEYGLDDMVEIGWSSSRGILLADDGN